MNRTTISLATSRVPLLVGVLAISMLAALCILALLTPSSWAQTAPQDCSTIPNPDADPDGDFLSNEQECEGNFDPDWWDTDDDGEGDAYEDSDRDNLLTHEEFKADDPTTTSKLEFDPLKAESDATFEYPLGNGIRDDFGDTDGDGLDTWEEFDARATPLNDPSCGTSNFPGATLKPKIDAFSPLRNDSFTLVGGVCTQDSVSDALEDTDSDGLGTSDEFNLRFDPNELDTDDPDDGVSDGNEPGNGGGIGRKHCC